MDDVRLTDGKGILTGNLQVDILYVGEERGIVSSLTAKLPFEETLNLKDIINGDKMCLKWEIEDLTIRLIHSRKLNIKALVTFCATVDETEQIRLPVALDAEEVSDQRIDQKEQGAPKAAHSTGCYKLQRKCCKCHDIPKRIADQRSCRPFGFSGLTLLHLKRYGDAFEAYPG